MDIQERLEIHNRLAKKWKITGRGMYVRMAFKNFIGALIDKLIDKVRNNG